MRRRRPFASFPLLAALVLAMGVAHPPGANAEDVVVQGTTDVLDSGLLDDVIVPGFEAAYPGDSLVYVPVGSGQALTNAAAGQGDAALVHAPTLELPFLEGGHSLEPFGRAVFYSDYVILGPAGERGLAAAHDTVTTFERIARAGGRGEAEFISRGDDSGTNTQEKVIWGLTDVPLNGDGEPTGGGGSDNPEWYRKAGTGQAQTVQIAEQCPFTSGSCYGMADRGTFNRLREEGAIDGLRIVTQRNVAGALGGRDLLVNPFTAYAVDPGRVQGANAEGASNLLDYLTSPAFQARLRAYPTGRSAAFVGDARPRITARASTVPSASGAGRRAAQASRTPDASDGSTSARRRLTVHGTVRSRLPGAPPPRAARVALLRSSRLAPGVRLERVLARTRADPRGRFRLAARRGRGSLRVLTGPIRPRLSATPLIEAGALAPATHKVRSMQAGDRRRAG